MIYEFLNKSPQFDDTVFVAPSADIIGDVSLGAESSIFINININFCYIRTKSTFNAHFFSISDSASY